MARPRHTWDEMKRGWDDADAGLAAITAQIRRSSPPSPRGRTRSRHWQRAPPSRRGRLPPRSSPPSTRTSRRPSRSWTRASWTGATSSRSTTSCTPGAPAGAVGNGLVRRGVEERRAGCDRRPPNPTQLWVSLGLGALAAGPVHRCGDRQRRPCHRRAARRARGQRRPGRWLVGTTTPPSPMRRAPRPPSRRASCRRARRTPRGSRRILDTVMALVDVPPPPVRVGRTILAGVRLEQALAARGVESLLEHLPADAEQAARAVQRGIDQLGVDASHDAAHRQRSRPARGDPAWPPGSALALERLAEARRPRDRGGCREPGDGGTIRRIGDGDGRGGGVEGRASAPGAAG